MDPAIAAGSAATYFMGARNGSADPTLIKLGDGLTQLAYAVKGIAESQQRIEIALVQLLRQSQG
jgi:hypothetical protein